MSSSFFRWEVCLTRPLLKSVSLFRGLGVSLTRPPCSSLSVRLLRSRSDTPRAGINLVYLVVLESLLHATSSKLSRCSAGGEFVLYARLSIMSGRSAHLQGLLHTPRWNVSARSAESGVSLTVSDISHAEFCPLVYVQSVSSFGKWELILNAPCWSLSVRSAGGEFLLHAPCWNLS